MLIRRNGKKKEKKKNHYTNSFLDSFHLLERGFWTFTERFTHFFF